MDIAAKAEFHRPAFGYYGAKSDWLEKSFRCFPPHNAGRGFSAVPLS